MLPIFLVKRGFLQGICCTRIRPVCASARAPHAMPDLDWNDGLSTNFGRESRTSPAAHSENQGT